jgi:hypothetical protein
MDVFTDIFAFFAGAPAIVGLFLTALIIFLTSDQRLALAALLAQYVLIGLSLTRFIQPEVAAVKILVGILVVPILYLGTRGLHPPSADVSPQGRSSMRLLGPVGWDAGPMGLPFRFLTFLLAVLVVTYLLGRLHLPQVPTDVAFVALWLGCMGILGLILGGSSLRLACALLTILSGFEMAYSGLERSLAIAGFYGALTLLTALAFSYLSTVQSLGSVQNQPDEGATEL